MSKLITITLLFLLHQSTLAETSGKQSLGIGYISNANLTADQPLSDFYTRLDSKWFGTVASKPFFFGISWLNYAKENSNNYLSVTLSSEKETENKVAGEFSITPVVFHRNYLKSTAATSDTSFTHTGFGVDLEKQFVPRPELVATLGTGYELRAFSNFSNRTDHDLRLASGDLVFDLNPTVQLQSGASLGVIVSSLSEYSRSYFDLSLGAEGAIDQQLSWNSELRLTSANYMNRTLSQATEITNRRGKIISSNIAENERTFQTSVQGGVNFAIDSRWSLNSLLSLTSQNSNNEVNSYSATELFCTLVFRGP